MSLNPGASAVAGGSSSGTQAVYFDPATPSVAATFSGSIATYFDQSEPTVKAKYGGGTFAVYFDPASPAVNASFSAASLEVVPSTGSRIMYDQSHQASRVFIVGSQPSASLLVSGITNSISAHILSTGGTIAVKTDPSSVLSGITSSVAVYLASTGGTIFVKQDPDGTLGAIRAALPSGTNDLGNIIRVKNLVDGTISTVTAVTNITNSVAVHVLSTGGTINVALKPGTIAVSLDPGYELGSVKGVNSSIAVYFDRGNPTVTAVGNVAHDVGDAGNPVKIGYKAIVHGANPTAVTADDRTDAYANRHGIPFVMGGHPNIQTIQANYTDADGAQTNAAIITVSSGTKIIVTHLAAICDNANTQDVQCRIGFGTANTPANDAAKVLLSHPGIPPGSGVVVGNGSGIIGIGADDEDLRITCEDPVGGSIDVVVGYYTIES